MTQGTKGKEREVRGKVRRKVWGVGKTQRGWKVKMCSPGAGCVEKERSLCAAGRMEGAETERRMV